MKKPYKGSKKEKSRRDKILKLVKEDKNKRAGKVADRQQKAYAKDNKKNAKDNNKPKTKSERLYAKSDKLFEKDQKLKSKATKKQQKGKNMDGIMNRRSKVQEKEQEAFNKASKAEQKEKSPAKMNSSKTKKSPAKFNKGLKKASADGKLDNNPKFKAAVDASPMNMKETKGKKKLKYEGPKLGSSAKGYVRPGYDADGNKINNTMKKLSYEPETIQKIKKYDFKDMQPKKKSPMNMSRDLSYGGPVIDQEPRALSHMGASKVLKHMRGSKHSPLNMNGNDKKMLAEHKKDAKNYTTSGIPESLYGEDGTKYNTNMLDEGNLSAIHRVHRKGEYVKAIERGTTGDNIDYDAGQKLFLKNPMKK